MLALAIARARHLLVRSVSEGAAAHDLSRFFDPGVAARIRTAAMSIKAGEGELRDVAIPDRRSARLQPAVDRTRTGRGDEGPAGLSGPGLPADASNGGSIDKFLGDGILASFGAVAASTTAAADALRAADAVIAAADRWIANAGPPACAARGRHGGVVGPGRLGAVGDGERLEFTVIGDAVNFAAKLESTTRTKGPGP